MPKGIPSRRGEKRLAIKVEDHPLAYAKFEGNIPADQYGAGTVMIWEEGFVQFKGGDPPDPAKELAGGRLEFTLEGKRLSGAWVLVRMRGEHDQWLLIRQGADAPALSKRLRRSPAQFAVVAEALAHLSVDAVMIDGEIVALDADGRPSFQQLQSFAMGEDRAPIYFYAFDLPWFEGRDLRALPIEDRKKKLASILSGAPETLRFSPFLGTNAERLIPQVKSLGFEGLVGKKRGSVYEAGQRSGAWVKLKFLHEQEFVVGGITAPASLCQPFGAILVGYYDQGHLRFAGKVGSGWSAAMQRLLHATFQPLVIPHCPFVSLPETGTRRWDQGITAQEMKRCRWLKPRLVCQVRFAEWTREHRLRQPVWVGLRPDKRARQVHRELNVQPRTGVAMLS